MPVRKEESIYEIRNLKLKNDSNGKPFLEMQIGHQDIIVLCTSKNGVRWEEIGNKLTRRNLYDLSVQGQVVLTDPACTLRGFSQNLIAAHRGLSGFALHPPVKLQLWSMQLDPFGGEPILYIPEESAKNAVVCKLTFAVTVRAERQGSILNVSSGTQSIEDFSNGSLFYRVGNHLPIPLTKQWLNKDIPLRAEPGEITVFPARAYEEKYECKRIVT